MPKAPASTWPMDPNNPKALEAHRLLLQWRHKAAALKVAIDEEREMRTKIVDLLFPMPKEGMNNFDLGNGYTLKAEIKYNYNLSKKDTKQALADMAAFSEEGRFLASRIVTWSPDLSVKEWRQLPAPLKPFIEKVLTIKPGLPSLNIEPPAGAT